MTENESIENKRKRLIFRANHRGTKEMDLILGSFANENVPGFSEDELVQFEELLTQNDPDLYNWISGKEQAPANVVTPVMEKLLSHKIN